MIAIALTWTRTPYSNLSYVGGKQLLYAVPAGLSVARVDLGWGFFGHTQGAADPSAVAVNAMVLGLVTTVGNGTETVPKPVPSAINANPPTQRWIWYEMKTPRVTAAVAGVPNLLFWAEGDVMEPAATKGQVLNPGGLPAGQTVNLWASWAPMVGAWDASGNAEVWLYAIVGVE